VIHNLVDSTDGFSRKTIGWLEALDQFQSKSDFTLLQSLLLVQKGTVEKALEILAGERIGLRIVKQTETKGIINRDSVLYGLYSGRQLVHAHSKIKTDLLPERVNSMIRKGHVGIGRVIEHCQLEIYMLIIETGHDKLTAHPFRIYRIKHKNKMAIEIRETLLI